MFKTLEKIFGGNVKTTHEDTIKVEKIREIVKTSSKDCECKKYDNIKIYRGKARFNYGIPMSLDNEIFNGEIAIISDGEYHGRLAYNDDKIIINYASSILTLEEELDYHINGDYKICKVVDKSLITTFEKLIREDKEQKANRLAEKNKRTHILDSVMSNCKEDK